MAAFGLGFLAVAALGFVGLGVGLGSPPSPPSALASDVAAVATVGLGFVAAVAAAAAGIDAVTGLWRAALGVQVLVELMPLFSTFGILRLSSSYSVSTWLITKAVSLPSPLAAVSGCLRW